MPKIGSHYTSYVMLGIDSRWSKYERRSVTGDSHTPYPKIFPRTYRLQRCPPGPSLLWSPLSHWQISRDGHLTHGIPPSSSKWSCSYWQISAFRSARLIKMGRRGSRCIWREKCLFCRNPCPEKLFQEFSKKLLFSILKIPERKTIPWVVNLSVRVELAS